MASAGGAGSRTRKYATQCAGNIDIRLECALDDERLNPRMNERGTRWLEEFSGYRQIWRQRGDADAAGANERAAD